MTRTNAETIIRLKQRLDARFGERGIGSSTGALIFASAPGRVELAGNHTDHQGGCTISAAIGRRAYALARPNGTQTIRMDADGFDTMSLDCTDLDPHEAERGTSLSLIRGMAAAYARDGGTLRGFDVAVTSDIPVGAGLSSSAAFEMLVGATIRGICDGDNGGAGNVSTSGGGGDVGSDGTGNGSSTSGGSGSGDNGTGSGSGSSISVKLDPTALALEGVSAEHDCFGKPCGAQDQLACAHGGIAAFDFAGPHPQVTPIEFDWNTSGYSLVLVDSRCDHSAYPDEYASVPADMFAVAHCLGHERLIDVSYPTFLSQLGRIRAERGDRATLRALHFFEENARVARQKQALECGDVATFLDAARRSGTSSAQFLQNVAPPMTDAHADQSALVVLSLCDHLLDGQGAFRIHGGGFGGSVLAFVPTDQAPEFRQSMNELLGYPACVQVLAGAPGVFAKRLGA